MISSAGAWRMSATPGSAGGADDEDRRAGELSARADEQFLRPPDHLARACRELAQRLLGDRCGSAAAAERLREVVGVHAHRATVEVRRGPACAANAAGSPPIASATSIGFSPFARQASAISNASATLTAPKVSAYSFAISAVSGEETRRSSPAEVPQQRDARS